MFSSIWQACKSIINRVKDTIKQWTKPATATLAAEAISDIARSKSDLFVENAILRQQLIVLKHSVKRPKFTTGDRTRLALLACESSMTALQFSKLSGWLKSPPQWQHLLR